MALQTSFIQSGSSSGGAEYRSRFHRRFRIAGLLGAVLALALGSAVMSPAQTTGTFTVMTYNVDGLPTILKPGGNPTVYTPIIGQKIRPYDIVNVQEDFNSHAALYANDNHPYRTATSGGAGIGSGLNTMSNFPFSDDIDRVTWTDSSATDGNNLTPKGFTWLRLRMAEGVYLDLYNVHTNAGDVDAALAARRSNITQIVNYINANSAGNAVMVFGDTNCRYTRTGDTIRDLLNAMGGDVWVNLIMGGIPPALGAPPLLWDYSTVLTSLGYEFVDKIFYKSNAYITLTPLSYSMPDATFRDSSGNMLSDHIPVSAQFQYTLAPGLKLSDQFGGPHGTSYNDVNLLPAAPAVHSIGIRTGSRVDGVNLTLSNGTTFVHGGTGGSPQTLNLASGEYVTKVDMNSGEKDGHTRVFWIAFTTNLGRVLTGGSATGTSASYTAPSGWQIVGFHGRSGDELDKMGVIFAPVK
jgi:hypothetical protein